MRNYKKILAVILSFALVLALVPFGLFSASAATELIWPVPATSIRSGSTYSGHIARDIGAGMAGTPIVAAIGGTVFRKYTCSHNTYPNSLNCCGGFGTGLAILGTDGRYYSYAHMTYGSIPESITVGSVVSAGQFLGNIGNTGNSHGPHLHFEIDADFYDGWFRNPIDPHSDIFSYTDYNNSIDDGSDNSASLTNVSSVGKYMIVSSSGSGIVRTAPSQAASRVNVYPAGTILYVSQKGKSSASGNEWYKITPETGSVCSGVSGYTYAANLVDLIVPGTYANNVNDTLRIHANSPTGPQIAYLDINEAFTIDSLYSNAVWVYGHDNFGNYGYAAVGYLKYTGEAVHTHQFSAATCTSPAKCIHEGCNVTQGTPLGHLYDNACDTECNRCGATRSISHSYGETWHSDANGHYHICSVCGDKTATQPHVFDNVSDTTCNVCGYTIQIEDSVAPTVSYAATNSVAGTQTITFTFSDDKCLKGLYFGIDPVYSNNSYMPFVLSSGFETATQFQINVSEAGTYYFTCDDACGNLSATDSITFYQTTFDANGGSTTPAAVLTKDGNTFDAPTPGAKSGCLFNGWASNPSSSFGINVIAPNSNETYYAVWTPISINISAESLMMTVGDSAVLTATTSPDDQTLTWESEDSSVATVENGKVTAKSAGSTVITVSFIHGGTTYSKTCTVTVEDKIVIDENAPQIVFESKRARKGTEFTITVDTKNNPGFSTASVKILYDTSRLQLESALLSEAYSNGAAVSYDNLPKITFVKSADVTADGTFLTLTFKALDNAEPGNAFVTLEYDEGDISNYDEDDVNFAIVQGTVAVVNYIPGDINNDEKVNTKDLTRLLKYLNDEPVEVNEYALDVNGDGKINTKDLTRLLKYLNDEPVEIF